ncbi:MAG: endonuclease III [Candidatus Eiseniibacteriota bacterium]
MVPVVPAARRRKVEPIPVPFLLATLKRAYPAARCSLDYGNAFELLVATILSAQCTDERVNMVTPEVFRRWPDAGALAEAELPEIEEVIRSTGFFRMKAKALSAMSRDLVEMFGGEPPRRLEDLVTLRGVGRKTANVVLGNAFGIESGVVVDTHVGRLSRRLGLTKLADPVKIEQDLMAQVPRKEWTLFSHLLIHHGRAICQARKPLCSTCPLLPKCPRVGVKISA